ncbi:MAG: ClpXP protease specificity-enhancing factor [Aquabacterium sp.]|nr:ClpXP protease specificity-enhancing factor [Aquabacterium sp.]MDX9843803.1 ClpXP protease specificity-enhancing factor [Aquabacterium sp.]
MSTEQEAQGTSTRPYLIRALHDWCTDNGFTPYVAVYVDRSVQVPQEYVKNNEIVLNVSFEATSQLVLGNEFVEFKARFGGRVRDILVPVDHVVAIYARENGQGMAFPVPTSLGGEGVDAPTSSSEEDAAAEPDAGDKAPAEARSVGLHLARAPKPAKDKASLKSVESEARPGVAGGSSDDKPEPPPSGGGRPTLRRIK